MFIFIHPKLFPDLIFPFLNMQSCVLVFKQTKKQSTSNWAFLIFLGMWPSIGACSTYQVATLSGKSELTFSKCWQLSKSPLLGISCGACLYSIYDYVVSLEISKVVCMVSSPLCVHICNFPDLSRRHQIITVINFLSL